MHIANSQAAVLDADFSGFIDYPAEYPTVIAAPLSHGGDEIDLDQRPLKYDALSRTLHWIFAVAIIYASVAGYSLHIVTNPALHSFLSQMNMSLATVLIALFPVRLAWRFLRTDPQETPGIPTKQQKIAHIAHSVLYVLIGWVLISGFLMVPHGYQLFWTFQINTPFEEGSVTHTFNVIHRVGCMTLASMVLLHVAAALKHHFIGRNNVLRKML